jgi:ribonuclease BN (tRNA processing enzyme)
VDAHAFLINGPRGSLLYSGDTGPTTHLWDVLNALPPVDLLLLEVSFPNRELTLATLSGHHTPATALADLKKYRALSVTNVVFYHIKAPFEAAVEREVARLRGLHAEVARLGERYRIG